MLALTTAILLSAHLLLVDVAMAGPLVCAWLDWRAARRDDVVCGAFARRLAWWSIGALLAGSALGGLLLVVRWQAGDNYFDAFALVPRSRLWFAAAELVFALVCLGLYAGLWNRWRKGRLWHRLLAGAASTNLLAHFPALFVIVSVIATRRPLAEEPLDRAAYQRLLLDGEVLSRVVHLWLAAGAVTGMFVVLMALRGKQAVEGPARDALVKTGARLTLASTALQFPVGLWVALAMPAASREALLGSDTLAAGLFMGALALAMLVLHVAAPLALGPPSWRPAWRSAAVLVALILLMVGTRVRLNRDALPAAIRAVDVSAR